MCECGCGVPLTGRQSRWASKECYKRQFVRAEPHQAPYWVVTPKGHAALRLARAEGRVLR